MDDLKPNKVGQLPLVLAVLLLIVIFLCTVPAPVSAPTANATPSAIGASDTTGDLLADVQADDASGASPSVVTTGDGWYTVDKNIVMFIDSFDTSGMSGTVTAATLKVQYSVEAGYTGTLPIRWALDGGILASTSIVPVDGQEDQTGSYDLYAQGVDTLAEISTLDIEFTNNDGAGHDAVSFDYVWVEVITELPPVFDFSVSASPDNLLVQQAGSVSTTVSVTLTSGTAQTVSLTGSWIGTAPGGVTPNFSPSSSTPNFGSTLTFETTAAASVGTFTYRATGTGGGQTHSYDITLNITELLLPVAPSLVSPENGITIDSLTPTFDWSDVTGATSYTLQVATDNNFSNIVLTKSPTESTATLSETEKLSYATHYYWRVRGANAAGSGDWSSTWSFTAKQAAPKVTAFEIAAGATYVNSTSVQLTIDAQNADEMSFSTDGVVWSDWETYQTSKSYALSGPDGSKNIYIRVKDSVGDISQTSAGSITLDQTPPNTEKDLSGDLGADGYRNSVVVTLSATDATSGVSTTVYRVDGGEWKTGNTFPISSDGKHTVEYYSTDAAGNAEGTKTLEVTVYTPTTFPPILTQYWWAFLGIIVGVGVASVFVSRKVKLSGRLKRITKEKREIIKLMKEAETRYYKEGTITRDAFDELIRGHEKRLTELEKEERVLKAKVKKVRGKRSRKRGSGEDRIEVFV